MYFRWLKVMSISFGVMSFFSIGISVYLGLFGEAENIQNFSTQISLASLGNAPLYPVTIYSTHSARTHTHTP